MEACARANARHEIRLKESRALLSLIAVVTQYDLTKVVSRIYVRIFPTFCDYHTKVVKMKSKIITIGQQS